MEFRFNVNEIFKTPIVEIGANLIPPGFQGDRRQLWEAVTKVSEIINTIGEASASAQGLTKPITTSERLRNAENQRLYLLIDRNSKTGKGCVTGMLKTGKKGLYVFDREGQHYQVQPNCVLDFYIHESRQRTGLGKHLFEHMLQKEEVNPVKLAIDRPSDKFLAFLKKHYNLESAIRQMNNYVVFEGFFPEEEKLMSQQQHSSNNNTMTTTIHLDKRGSNGLQQQAVTSPYGRYGAPRPPCSMGQIIHNQSAVVGAQEPSGCSLNMKASKERSTFTLRRASRHPNEEMRKQYYAPPRLPFTPCAAVGNGLGYSPSLAGTNLNQQLSSPTLQESNIQLVTKEQMLQAASERQQQQRRSERPQSLLQNLPSPDHTQTGDNSKTIYTPNLVNNTLVQQNVKLLDTSQSNLIRSPSGLRYYHAAPNLPPQQINLQLCNTHSQMVANNAPANVQPSDTRILRPKPLITDPLKDYLKNSTNNSPVSATNVNQNHQPQQQYQQVPVQYVQQMPNQQYTQAPVVPNNHGDQQNSPRTFYWQNQIYPSRDAPTNYPFVGNKDNPNRFYVTHEECGECKQEQQQGAGRIDKIENQTALPAVFNTQQFVDQNGNKFPNDFQQQNMQQNQLAYYQHQQQSLSPPSEGQLKQQTYQLNSQNLMAPNEFQQATSPPNDQQQINLCQAHHQQQQNRMAQEALNGSIPNIYQTLPTIAETESELAISAKDSKAQVETNAKSMSPQRSISKFNANIPPPQVTSSNQAPPYYLERKPLQELPRPRSNEHVRMEPPQEQFYNQHHQQQKSPRYTQNNVTSQNVANFEAQSPRLNQHLVQQQQAEKLVPPQQTFQYDPQEHQNDIDYSQQYQHPRQNQNAHDMRPLSSYPATMYNAGNFEQQSPRLNLEVPKSLSIDAYAYPQPPSTQSFSQEVQQHQKPSPRPSNELQSTQGQEQVPLRPENDVERTSSSNLKNSPLNRSPSPTRYRYATNNAIHKSPINHLEYNYTLTDQSKVSPNDKSEQVKPNCLPERTPRLNSDQASASTQINIPKYVPISPGYNQLSKGSYKNVSQQQQQDGLSDRRIAGTIPGTQGINDDGRPPQNQRDSGYNQYAASSATKIETPHIPTMKGDMMAISSSGGSPRPIQMRPEITSQ